VFKISAVSPYAVTTLHSFAGGSSDGNNPDTAGVFEGSDGSFYGTTAYGGESGYGTVFKVSSDGTSYSVLHSFAGGVSDGEQPSFGVLQASDGNFYGTTGQGGTYGEGGDFNGYGTIFEINPEGTETLLYSFAGGTGDGYGPEGGLAQGLNGNFYGMTGLGETGTSCNCGTVFKITASPPLSAPVQLTVPSSVPASSIFTLAYTVANAYSNTLQQCFATNTAGDTTGWVAIKTASAATTNATLTASGTPGTYTYTLTCGGMETASHLP